MGALLPSPPLLSRLGHGRTSTLTILPRLPSITQSRVINGVDNALDNLVPSGHSGELAGCSQLVDSGVGSLLHSMPIMPMNLLLLQTTHQTVQHGNVFSLVEAFM